MMVNYPVPRIRVRVSLDDAMMKVLFDDRGFLMVHGGVAKYFTELFRNFSPDVKAVLGFKWTYNYYLQQPPFSMPEYENQGFQDFVRTFLLGWNFRGAGHLYFWLNALLPRIVRHWVSDNVLEFCRLLKEGDCDLVHLTAPHEYGKLWKKIPADKPVVVTVVDLIPELVQGQADIMSVRREVLKRATRIITISDYTKQMILETYDVPKSKIDLVYLGHQENDCAAPIEELKGIRFILFVGKRGGYKNFDFFVKAVAPLLANDRELKLVCTGNKFKLEELELFDSLGIRDSVIQHFVSDEEMTWLYQNAKAFVFPSKAEGFGIPILDAFSAGCPVLLSRASCFPEIAQDAALYFELDNAEDLRQQLTRLLTDEDLCRSLRAKEAARVKNFSWEKCARETETVYRKCLEGFDTIRKRK